MSRKFTCAVCGGNFTSAWTHEEAVAEKEQLWGDIPLDQCSSVCDDCHNKIQAWLKENEGRA